MSKWPRVEEVMALGFGTLEKVRAAIASNAEGRRLIIYFGHDGCGSGYGLATNAEEAKLVASVMEGLGALDGEIWEISPDATPAQLALLDHCRENMEIAWTGFPGHKFYMVLLEVLLRIAVEIVGAEWDSDEVRPMTPDEAWEYSEVLGDHFKTFIEVMMKTPARNRRRTDKPSPRRSLKRTVSHAN
jgi:hypothetical protein